jgi:hypothetical protein
MVLFVHRVSAAERKEYVKAKLEGLLLRQRVRQLRRERRRKQPRITPPEQPYTFLDCEGIDPKTNRKGKISLGEDRWLPM